MHVRIALIQEAMVESGSWVLRPDPGLLGEYPPLIQLRIALYTWSPQRPEHRQFSPSSASHLLSMTQTLLQELSSTSLSLRNPRSEIILKMSCHQVSLGHDLCRVGAEGTARHNHMPTRVVTVSTTPSEEIGDRGSRQSVRAGVCIGHRAVAYPHT
jgi:hypothetical protein